MMVHGWIGYRVRCFGSLDTASNFIAFGSVRDDVNALCKSFDATARVMSKHIRILEQVSLIQRSRQGQLHLLQLVPDKLGSTKEWIDFIRRA